MKLINVTRQFTPKKSKVDVYMFATNWFLDKMTLEIEIENCCKIVVINFDYSNFYLNELFHFCFISKLNNTCYVYSEKMLAGFSFQNAIDEATQPYKILRISKEFGL